MDKTILAGGLVGGFERDGLVRISYPEELREGVLKAVSSWEVFCALDKEKKEKFPYNANAGMGVGYELKELAVAARDLKEDFHFTAAADSWLTATAEKLQNKEALAVIHDSRELLRLMEPIVFGFAQQIEKTFMLDGFVQEIMTSKDMWFLRFIHYFGGHEIEDEIAAPHADKSGFTLHLYESDPGLQYLDFEKRWKDMPVGTRETVIIPGMRLQYRSMNRSKAMYHRVIATEKTARDGRFAIVCFIHLKNTPEYDKKKGGRLQEFSPGFNYNMPFEEFSKLFKKE